MLGERIAEQRKKLGLSQEELAEKLNISQKSISKYERGDRRPSYEVLVLMAALFDVTTDYLLGEEICMVGTRIAELRKGSGMTQENLAEALNISRSTLAGYEAENKHPPYRTLVKIAKYFGVSIYYLMGITDRLLGEEESGETHIVGGGNIIKEFRKEICITQEELGKKLGVSKQTVSAWERGVSEVSNNTLVALTSLFPVTMDYLLGMNRRNHITNRLKALREENGMNQSELGKLLNVQGAAISKYESGEVPLTGETIVSLAEYFGVTTDYLLGVEGDTMSTEENTNEIMQRVGRNIRSIREQAGLSQDEFAEGFSVKQPTVANWETGKRQPDLNMLIQIAHFGGTNLDDLVMKELTPPVPLYVQNMIYLRKKIGYSQSEMAMELGLQGPSSIDIVESGKRELPVSKLIHLAEFFRVTMDQITKKDLSQEVSGCRQQ